MTKNWEAYKHEIIELYCRGCTLVDVQQAMESRHGFQASSRAYKMKLISWGIRKNRSVKNEIRLKSEEKTPPPSPIEVQRHGRKSSFSQGIFNDPRSESHPDSPIGVHAHSRKPSFSQGIFDEVPHLSHSESTDSPEGVSPLPGLPSREPTQSSTIGVQPSSPRIPHFIIASQPRRHPPSGSPSPQIVNLSFRFFSDRPEVETLDRLVNNSALHPHAIYILLWNWKPNHPKGIYMKCAQQILDNPACCHSILNYVYTWDLRTTLFDIICYGNFSLTEKQLLITALLSTDLKFAHPLKGHYSSWAVTWRKASQQWNWEQAKRVLETRKPEWEVQIAALSIMRGYFQMMEPPFSN